MQGPRLQNTLESEGQVAPLLTTAFTSYLLGLGYRRRQGLKLWPHGYKPAITHAMFVCPEMLSHVCNASPVILHTHSHLSSPQHTEKICFPCAVRFCFTMRHNDQLLLTQVVQETQKRFGLAGLRESGPSVSKTYVLQMSVESFEQLSPQQ